MNSSQFTQKLPFEVDISIYPPLEEMRLHVVARSKQAGQNLELLREVLSYFVSSANAGMFSSPPFSPEQAFMRIESSDDPSGDEIRSTWESRYVSLGAYKILLGMVAQSHHGHVPLAFFGLSSVSKVGNLMRFEGVVSSLYPERAAKVPFDLDLAGDLDSVTMPAIRMEFIRSLDPNEFQTVEQLIADWHTLILLGGYLDSYEAMDKLPMNPGKTYLASPTTVEHVLYGFTGPSAVYDALINMAVKLHKSFCPISRIEIE